MSKSGKKVWGTGVKSATRGITPVQDAAASVFKEAFGGKKRPKFP